MNFKKQSFLIFLSCMVFMMLPLIGGGAEVGELKPVELIFSSGWSPPDVGIAAKNVVIWQEKVTEASDGKITFKNYWGGALGGARDHIDMVEKGIADVVLTFGWLTESKLPIWDFHYVIPFQPVKDPGIITKATLQLYDEIPAFKEQLAKVNCTMVMRFPATPYVLASTTPINSVKDLEGKKIAAVGAYFSQWLKPLGASLVAAPKTERYSMLQLNVIDVSLDPYANLYEYDQVSMAPHVFNPEIFQAPGDSVFINLDTLNGLPQEYQDILLDTGREVALLVGEELIGKASDDIINKWKSDNPDFTMTNISSEEKDWWGSVCPDTATPWAEKVEEQGYPGFEIIKRYKEICTELGYDWPGK